MARDLSKDVAWHDDATSKKHQIDKAAAAMRRKTHYAPEPAVETRAGASIVEGKFKSPTLGFSFIFRAGFSAVKMDGKEYTRNALEMSEARRRYSRTRIRDGKSRRDYGYFKHGAVSLVTTLPPWAVKTVARIGPAEREDLMMRLAEAQARRIHDDSWRPAFGGGCHLDTAIPHFHLHIPKTSETGIVFPKEKFLTAGPWLVGAIRIEEKFPGLLSGWKRDRVQKHLKRKRLENLIDVAATAELDRELERWIKEKGFWADYENDCREYCTAKEREQKSEPQKRLVQSALGYHSKTGVWPLAYQAMDWAMWKMIPKELRPAITVSIKVFQLMKNPVRGVIPMGKTMIRMAKDPEITPPKR